MTGADDQPSSAVADEAVRLAAALAALTTPPESGAEDTGQAPHAASARQEPAGAAMPEDEQDAGTGDDAEAAGGGPGCACGSPSVQAICDVCPVCRVAALLSEVRPETVERVADLLSMVVGSLEAFAAQRRTEMAGSEAPDRSAAPSPASSAGEHAGWQPVDVEDEDEDT